MSMIEQQRPGHLPAIRWPVLFRSRGPPPEPFVHRHTHWQKLKGVTCTAACRPVERGGEIGTRQARSRPVRLAACSKARVSSIACADGVRGAFASNRNTRRHNR
jgi:hypothetical protein